MHFKLIIAFINDDKTQTIIDAAREGGALGSTVITNARGEGLNSSTTFFGLNLNDQRDMVLFLVEEHLSRAVLEAIGEAGQMDSSSGAGITFQIDVEDAIGLSSQARELRERVEDEI